MAESRSRELGGGGLTINTADFVLSLIFNVWRLKPISGQCMLLDVFSVVLTCAELRKLNTGLCLSKNSLLSNHPTAVLSLFWQLQ